MNWQPIETAPIDVPLLLGRWANGYGDPPLKWRTTIGCAWETKKTWWGWRRVVRSSWDRESTHWMPIPEPPEEQP